MEYERYKIQQISWKVVIDKLILIYRKTEQNRTKSQKSKQRTDPETAQVSSALIKKERNKIAYIVESNHICRLQLMGFDSFGNQWCRLESTKLYTTCILCTIITEILLAVIHSKHKTLYRLNGPSRRSALQHQCRTAVQEQIKHSFYQFAVNQYFGNDARN